MEFEIRITGTTDKVFGKWNSVEDFVKYFQAEADRFPTSYNMAVELIEKSTEEPEPKWFINEFCDKACYVEGDVIKCHNIGNEFTTTVAGFPVDHVDGRYMLYDAVFNDGQVPKGWDDVKRYREYEDNALSPWLRSMGFVGLRWSDGERDSFGPLSRVCRMVKDGVRFEFMYG